MQDYEDYEEQARLLHGSDDADNLSNDDVYSEVFQLETDSEHLRHQEWQRIVSEAFETMVDVGHGEGASSPYLDAYDTLEEEEDFVYDEEHAALLRDERAKFARQVLPFVQKRLRELDMAESPKPNGGGDEGGDGGGSPQLPVLEENRDKGGHRIQRRNDSHLH